MDTVYLCRVFSTVEFNGISKPWQNLFLVLKKKDKFNFSSTYMNVNWTFIWLLNGLSYQAIHLDDDTDFLHVERKNAFVLLSITHLKY